MGVAGVKGSGLKRSPFNEKRKTRNRKCREQKE